ncbi:tetratricopeptide repeat protein [uncultured Sphingomonas sp.]|uniref:tetratricopeptide repeat protein n=1 Tax=uncultured Sphingomonas sp. TaxID=158754 RepID=UPI0025FA5BF0|nr:tetratricopeptide repeat protein [uncultured Sphingomonas sp.]
MGIVHIVAALALGVQVAPSPPSASPPGTAAPPSLDERMTPELEAAARLLRAHQPQAVVDRLAPVIAAYDADLAHEARRIYCGESPQETLLYLAMAAKDKVSAVAIAPGYCTALYMKGYALVDLGRVAEAKAIYERLLALAPMYAQYQTEYGQLIRLEKDWPRMLDICTRSAAAAKIADPQIRVFQEGAALRCQGYALIEMQRWDEAEARYRQALVLDPNDAKAKNELTYIAEQRAKAKSGKTTT